MIKVNVVRLNKELPLPKYATALSAGMDLYASIENEVCIPPMGRVVIPTGIKVALPAMYEIQIRPRSGMAIKNGITVLNTPGTIDADYRGELGVILINLSNEDFFVNPADRIAQAVLNKIERIILEEVDSLDETERGEGGYGHSGTK